MIYEVSVFLLPQWLYKQQKWTTPAIEKLQYGVSPATAIKNTVRFILQSAIDATFFYASFVNLVYQSCDRISFFSSTLL